MANSGLSESGFEVRRAAVIGAGTMGAQIAALLAGFGIECELLDLPDTDGRDRRAEAALEKLATMRPSPLFARADLDRIRPGNVEDHCERLTECDWVIEAVFEDLACQSNASGPCAGAAPASRRYRQYQHVQHPNPLHRRRTACQTCGQGFSARTSSIRPATSGSSN